MHEVYGDLFKSDADMILITTNGVVKENGELVMGAGIAKKAALLYPHLPKLFGDIVAKYGQCVYVTGISPYLVMFPTKYHWRNNSSLNLIRQSAKELSTIVGDKQMKIASSRPGCGNGNLDWNIVKTILELYFDDRYYIYTN